MRCPQIVRGKHHLQAPEGSSKRDASFTAGMPAQNPLKTVERLSIGKIPPPLLYRMIEIDVARNLFSNPLSFPQFRHFFHWACADFFQPTGVRPLNRRSLTDAFCPAAPSSHSIGCPSHPLAAFSSIRTGSSPTRQSVIRPVTTSYKRPWESSIRRYSNFPDRGPVHLVRSHRRRS